MTIRLCGPRIIVILSAKSRQHALVIASLRGMVISTYANMRTVWQFLLCVVQCLIVAPLAQRLEQRPFKSWVQGSNPWGGTTKELKALIFQRFELYLFSFISTNKTASILITREPSIITLPRQELTVASLHVPQHRPASDHYACFN